MFKRRLVSSGAPLNVAERSSAPQEGGEPINTKRRISRLDYDGKIDSFAKLIQLLQGLPSYTPNEADLKVASLKTLLADLQLKTQQVSKASNAYKQACIARTRILNGPGGVSENAGAAKDYIRAAFGVRSDIAKQVGQINFW